MKGEVRNALVIVVLAGLLVTACESRPRGSQVVITPAGQIVAEAPPQPKFEEPGAAPVAGYQWIPGFWVQQDYRWVWIPGHWEAPPRKGVFWVPGHWDKAGQHWGWTPGQWEQESKPQPSNAETEQ